ncbi:MULTISPECIES: cache domain-containing protein [Ralstonia solanacearum species complex]|uniref:Cache domain-containing protein n=9 Tax=Ralstonia solanacearum species complex TaxID=3116862 RepID=A0A0S4WKH5_RALSL|nr:MULTISPECIES: cache domain-containing protein [Ralstonia]QWQ11995.1 cache domain-containing protein [Ralstonia solanacearum]MCK4155281.1 histidine kinase [Ralstonia pseudosolanacearum]MDO3559035.1 cache domain-containing protein [Ralstonia pseudosolanacearum]MDO3578628.1 cache domain-containing protein [Ralstonia pseudosolanacearum]MDO3588069.1 cache domain-containing protein [Ralstonia pseudosolanacearum]
MKLRQKILLLAVAPLTIAMLAIMLTVRHQSIALAQHERQLVESAYLQAKEAELRAHVKLARSAIAPLLASGRSDQATRDEAMRTLARLDFGPDGYFFLYDLRGRNLMHPRQPELVGRDLWSLTDARGQPTIQRLVAAAQTGGGFVRYLWDKPSSHQSVAKLGYVEPIPQWGWMVGTGLYLDDVEQTLREIDRRAQANIDQTLAWVVAIAAVCILLVAGSGLALNVSDHREADAKLRQLAQQVVHSQEDERARVSRELHDGISQVLVSTKLLLETAHGHLEPPPGHATPPGAPATDKAAGMLRRALDRLNGALGEVRRVSHNLRPALLDDLGLAAALELLVRETREAHEDRQPGFAITLETAGPPVQLPDACNTAFFRIAQEAVSNIERHATGATRIGLLLENDLDAVRLSIRDNGPGFDVESVQVDPEHGIGLRNMRERMAALGGTCTIVSGPHGTEVGVALPHLVIARLASAAASSSASVSASPSA